jgi:hypothetical protein
MLDVADIKLKDNYLELKIDVNGKRVAQPLIFFAPGDFAIAQNIYNYVLKKRPELTPIPKTEEGIRHMIETDDRFIVERERIKRNEESIEINNQLERVLDELEIHINRNVFTELEMQKIAELKRSGISIQNRLAELTQQNIKQLGQHTALLKRKGNNDDAKTLYKQIQSLDKQICSVDAENVTQLESLKNWLTLGQQRPTDFGLPK